MKVDILGIEYNVNFVNQVSKYDSLLGEINHIEQVITIDKDLQKDRQKEVLLHEILHGITEAVGIDDKLNEQDVQALGRALYTLFKSNKAIFSFEIEQSLQQI